MKKVFLFLTSIFFVIALYAQVPQAINYQGIARNASGNALANQNIQLRLSIRNGSSLGNIIYQETRSFKTNSYGMFNVAIGSLGTISTIGTLSSINWSDGSSKFLQVEVDNNGGGNSFVNLGASQLLSVPYAIYASSAAPAGPASGSLTGTYPNPQLADNSVTAFTIADNAVTTTKIADNSISATKIIDNAISTAKIANNAISTAKIADSAITTDKIQNGSVTAEKLAPGLTISGGSGGSPSGNAGGDLNGTYPNPSLAPKSVTTNKIDNGAVTSNKLADGSVTTNKLADAAVTTVKINDGAVTLAKLAPGVIPAAFSLPYSASVNSTSTLLSVTQQGSGIAISGINTSNTGVFGSSENAEGVKGTSTGVAGYGVFGSSVNGTGVFGSSDKGIAGFFTSGASNYNDALFVTSNGYGNGVSAISTNNNGVVGITNNATTSGIFGINNANGEAVTGRTFSASSAAVVGQNYDTYAGVKGANSASGGTGILGQANVDGATGGTAIVGELVDGSSGNVAVFKANGANVARIDNTGKAYFNNGTQVGGADLAEYFSVEGSRSSYEPGDVLAISLNANRKVEKSSEPYSFLVSGVYATKAGLLLTEENAEKDQLQQMVPMGVIGVIPTKVCVEGGEIKRGDLLVTSSLPGVAMKGDINKIKVGQVIGKALENFTGEGTGKIKVLVSIK